MILCPTKKSAGAQRSAGLLCYLVFSSSLDLYNSIIFNKYLIKSIATIKRTAILTTNKFPYPILIITESERINGTVPRIYVIINKIDFCFKAKIKRAKGTRSLNTLLNVPKVLSENKIDAAGVVNIGLLPESLFISSYFKVLIPEFKRKIERAKGINAFSNPQ
jgi:hypothetical protein